MDLTFELKTKQTQKLYTGMQIGNFLEKSDKDFWSLISEIETHPLFLKLYKAKGDKKAVKINPRNLQIYPELTEIASFDKIDVEDILDENKELTEKIKKIGRDKFIFLFLKEENISDVEISALSGLSIDEVQYFKKNVLEKIYISDINENFHKLTPQTPTTIKPIANINDNLEVILVHDRKRYEIYEDRLNSFYKTGYINPTEKKELEHLKQKMNLVNIRINLINTIIINIVEIQKDYLKTGKITDLIPLQMNELSKIVQIHPSWLSRLIKDKTVKTPWNELPVRFFFISRKKKKQTQGLKYLSIVLEKEKNLIKKGQISKPYSDNIIQNILLKEYGLRVSRRTINFWKNSIKK